MKSTVNLRRFFRLELLVLFPSFSRRISRKEVFAEQ